MSDARPTPGAWEAIKTPYGNWMVRCCGVDHPENSRPHQPALIWWHEEHAEANAKLLAAAWLLPELAEAVQALLERPYVEIEEEEMAEDFARAALARYEEATKP
jgi:hypothetical protein